MKRVKENMESGNTPFYIYFENWVETYKRGLIREITMRKYIDDVRRIKEISPGLLMKDIDRAAYQKLINKFGEKHSKQTVIDFHHHMKACILDAIDDGVIDRDPTRKIVIKAASVGRGKKNFLSIDELNRLLGVLKLGDEPDGNWLIWLLAKTGMRFAEALGLTPEDFDFKSKTITVNKTWDYKIANDFAPTKNQSSVRVISMDWEMVSRISGLISKCLPGRPIFVPEGKRIFNTTYNDLIRRKCIEAGVKIITIHGLRHTHASILFASGISMPSIAKRLGHSGTETTQKVYMHLINELEEKDRRIMQGALSGITGV